VAYLDGVTSLAPWGGPKAQYVGFSAAAASAIVTGTLDTATETQLVAGGRTYIWTIANDTLAAAGTGPIGSIANTQALIDGIASDQAEANGWDVEKANIAVTDVVRNSDTRATLTLPALATFDISINETLTGTIPAAVLVTSAIDVVATPTFSITFVAVVDDAVTPVGGWLTVYDPYLAKMQRRKDKRQARQVELDKLEGTDREIARILHKDLEYEARTLEIAQLDALVQSMDVNAERSRLTADVGAGIAATFTKAYMQSNFSALEAFERELEDAREEEEFLFLAIALVS